MAGKSRDITGIIVKLTDEAPQIGGEAALSPGKAKGEGGLPGSGHGGPGDLGLRER